MMSLRRSASTAIVATTSATATATSPSSITRAAAAVGSTASLSHLRTQTRASSTSCTLDTQPTQLWCTPPSMVIAGDGASLRSATALHHSSSSSLRHHLAPSTRPPFAPPALFSVRHASSVASPSWQEVDQTCSATASATAASAPGDGNEQSRVSDGARDAVPAEVRRRIDSAKGELHRLFTMACESGPASALRLEAALSKHLGLLELSQQQQQHSTASLPATTSSATAAAPPSSPSPSSAHGAGRRLTTKVPEAWLVAVWAALAPHCYFTAGAMEMISSSSLQKADFSAKVDSAQRVRVVPFDWSAAMSEVAAALPYEGWSEAQVVECLQAQHRVLLQSPPLWPPRFTAHRSLAHLVHARFSGIVVVTRSAVSGAPLFHAAHRNSVAVAWLPASEEGGHRRTLSPSAAASGAAAAALSASSSCVSLQHALHALGRGHQLPIWTEAAGLAPLMPPTSPLHSASPAAWKAAWLADPQLRRAFVIDAYVCVRAAPTPSRLVVVVDTTTLTARDVAAVAGVVSASPLVRDADSSAITVQLLTRKLAAPRSKKHANGNDEDEDEEEEEGVNDSAAMRRALQSLFGPAAMLEPVVVDAMLEPVHVLSALLASPLVQPPSSAGVDGDARANVAVLVMCGRTSQSAFDAVAREVAGNGEAAAGTEGEQGVTVQLVTPLLQ